MTNKLYVGNLPYTLDEVSLKAVFTRFGYIVNTKIIKDRETNQSRGFGVITFSLPEEACQALVMGGQMLQGRKLYVKFARERQYTKHYGEYKKNED